MAKTKTSIDSIKVVQPELVRPGSRVTIAVQFQHELREGEYAIDFEPPGLVIDPETQTAFCEITGRSLKIESGHSVKKLELEFEVPRETHLFGPQTLRVAVNRDQPPVSESASAAVVIEAPRQVEVTEFPVVVTRKETVPSNYTRNIILHKQIKSGTDAMKFPEFKRHLDLLLCGEYKGQLPPEWIGGFASELLKRRFLPFSDTEAYRVLKVATEAFVLLKCQTAGPPLTHAEFNEAIKGEAERIGAVHVPDDPLQDFQDNYLQGGLLPYLRLVFDRLGDSRLKDSIFPGYNPDAFIANPQITGCIGALKEKLRAPILIELIWSYWHEQAMQVQTMFAIRNRFQNISSAPGGDPLAGMEIGALRPLNNLLWGYIQDE